MKNNILTSVLSFLIMGNLYAQPFSISATIPYNNSYASGTYQIFRNYSTSNITLNNLRKPLVFVEGFDPNGIFGIDYIYQMLYFSNTNLATRIHNAGYDIIILNFDDGGDYIQKNAFLLVELINQINTQKPNNEPLVVVGFSMGGLVARYALTYMEQHGMDHETKLYVSFDSPHKGAHIPVGIQALALTFDDELYQQMFPELASSLLQFTAPAARQMLKYRISDPTQASGEISMSSDHQTFLNELENLNSCNGFPTTCRNIAISLGSWNGVGQWSNLDIDNNSIDDLQHSAFPTLYINIPQGDGDEDKWIWQLNTCEAISILSFQIFLSTSLTSNYPYYSERYSYANLENDAYATYWYRNSDGPLWMFFPYGSWSRIWWYLDEEPTDFAPGSFVPAYEYILDALNSQIDCSFGYADNSTFVPTVSALAFDTDDLFYNIQANQDRLDKTPFDNIIGISGDNTSHRSNQASNSAIANWLMNEITGNLGTTCAKGTEHLSGTVNSGEHVTISEVSNIETSNYTIKSGANVQLNAGKGITINSVFNAELGSTFSAQIVPCSAKPCAWHPSSTTLKSAVIKNQFDTTKIIKDAPRIPKTESSK